jgi:hypothetical protein
MLGWSSGAGDAGTASGHGLDRHQRFQSRSWALQMLGEINRVRRPVGAVDTLM